MEGVIINASIVKWLKTAVSKTAERKLHGGSNPSRRAMKYLCINNLKVFDCDSKNPTDKSYTFKEGTIYDGNKVNDKYYVIDSFGIKLDIFNNHFKLFPSP